MNSDAKSMLGAAINEADLLGVEASRTYRGAAVTLRVLTLPADASPPPADRRVSLVLHGVSRVAASLREAHWSDPKAPAVPFALDQLLTVTQSFGGLPIYGREFIDVKGDFEQWSNRLSLDEHLEGEGHGHSLRLFQEAAHRHLDLMIWFDELQVFKPDGQELSIEEFYAGADRWWRAHHAGDPRTKGLGLFPTST